ncbi:hypothetical protein FA13DRAFT_1725428, partial [Coprinellus micaceus]
SPSSNRLFTFIDFVTSTVLSRIPEGGIRESWYRSYFILVSPFGVLWKATLLGMHL